MDQEAFNIPVSLLRQFFFCRRIPFLTIVRNLNPPRGKWVDLGVDFHSTVEKLLKRRDLTRLSAKPDYVLKTEVDLYSKKMHMHGSCDGVIFFGENAIALEIKDNDYFNVNIGTKMQLIAYAMLIEEQFKVTVDNCFILLPSSKSIKIKKTLEDERIVFNTIADIEIDCKKGVLPKSCCNENKCTQCEFLNFCADRL